MLRICFDSCQYLYEFHREESAGPISTYYEVPIIRVYIFILKFKPPPIKQAYLILHGYKFLWFLPLHCLLKTYTISILKIFSSKLQIFFNFLKKSSIFRHQIAQKLLILSKLNLQFNNFYLVKIMLSIIFLECPFILYLILHVNWFLRFLPLLPLFNSTLIIGTS